VEHGFRSWKDVLALWPIYHRVEPRVKAHIFVAFLALLLQRLLTKRLKEAEADLSAPHALQAVETIQLVEFKVGRQNRQGASRDSSHARQLLKALGIRKTKPPVPAAGPHEVV
jgi:transposase